jgi:hypothetical protein
MEKQSVMKVTHTWAKCGKIKLKLPTSDLEVFKNKGKDNIIP